MPVCPYFRGDEYKGRKHLIRCGEGNGHGGDFIYPFEDASAFTEKMSSCFAGERLENCRPFLFRQLKAAGKNPTSETTTGEMQKIYAEIQQEEKTMENKPESIVEIKGEAASPEYTKACTITRQILANASVAAESMLEVCRGLKQMRDEKLFLNLGYQSFDAYTEDALNIKGRQAYNYISAYERLGPTVLQANASLGITKLVLLAEAPATERENLTENNDLAGMSTREVEELVKKVQDQGEQLSLLTTERDKLKENKNDSSAELEKLRSEYNELRERLKEAQKSPVASAPTIDEQEIERLKAEAAEKARKEAEKTAKEKQKAAVEKAVSKATADAAKKAADARAEGEKAGKEAAEASIKAMEKEKAALVERSQQLEKKLSVSGDADTAQFSVLFAQEQEIFNKMSGVIMKVSNSDKEKADKLRGALLALLKRQTEEGEK